MPQAPDQNFHAVVGVEVEKVLQDSEYATLALGANLSEIVAKAEEFVEQLQGSVGVIGSSGEGSISHTLDLQTAATDAFVRDLGVVIADNSNIADRVIETTGNVSEAAQAVSDVASAARMLCFNTKIEAGRLGDLGRPFIVIADQMRELSEAIAQSNDRISLLTAALTPLLKEVKSSVHSLQGRTSEFTVQNGEHREAIQTMSRKLQNATADTIAAGDEKLAEIIARSGDSLVALQTQDIVSQRLRKILTLVASLADNADAKHPQDIGFLSEELPPSEDSLNAGEMELF
ncbi:Methyl-accepting chemotaxis protein McpC [Planctomycetes bacterium Poly30]|uniref:Methyl-accepting chemotaxis protein McpC n=1 Tax=Saltatorellus ferox TaxID=2528018 RepID=A0A518F0U1_9BACT|nr:Methyl-accepting chemotaxis protein McpC [Planctomycetes bacterium Poly30]